MSYILRPICALILCAFLYCESTGQFIFSYEGPDTLYVDSSCTAILDWGHPETPDVFPTMPGQVIISWSIFSISGGYMIGDPVPAGTTVTVFYEARDNMGHISLFGFNLPVWDGTPPEFAPGSIPEDVTVMCASNVDIPDLEFSDNCDPDSLLELTYSDSGNADACQGGVVVRTWLLSDASDNTTSVVQNITVIPDTVSPTITGIPQNGMAPCGDAMDDYSAWIEAQRVVFMADDIGCGIAELTDNAPPASALLGFCGDLDVAFFATDSCDNTTSVIATFSVLNDVAPEISVEAADGMASCASGDPFAALQSWLADHGGAEATDDCSLITWSTDPAQPSIEDACDGFLTVTFIANDGCGNTASSAANFFVQDTTPPVIQSQAQSVVFNCSTGDWIQELGEWMTTSAGASATDVCTEEDSLIVQFDLNGTLLDSAGVIAAFEDSIMDGTCVDGVIINGFLWNNVLAMMNLGFVFTDVCGNTSTTSAIFAITDAVGPQFTLAPQDSILTCAGGDIAALFTEWYEAGGFAESHDDCGVVYYTGTPAYEEALQLLMEQLDTACATGAMVEVSFQVHDFCGNTNPDAASAMFGIIDNTGPAFVQEPYDLLFNCDGASQTALIAWLDSLGGAQVQEACGNILWEFTWEEGGMQMIGEPETGPYPGAGDLACNDGLEVIFTATDICDNSVSAAAVFLVMDTVPPSIIVEPELSISCDSLAALVPEVSDNCSSSPVVFYVDQTMNGDTTSCLSGTIIRTWVATDDCGNTVTAVQTIQTEDNTPPVFIAPADTIIYCTSGEPIMSGEPTGVVDNCDPDPFVTYEDMLSGTGCNATTSRTWIVQDACGNMSTAVQMISLVDTIVPIVETEPEDLIIECADSESTSAMLNLWLANRANASVIDNCGDVTMFLAESGSYEADDTLTWPGTEPSLPALTCGNDTLANVDVDFVYADPCGNVGVIPVSILVLDVSPPEFVHCVPDTMISLEPGKCEGEVRLEAPVAFDLCGADLDNVQLEMESPIVSSAPGDSSTVVDTIVMQFPVPGPPVVTLDPVTLSINIRGADIDTTTEFYTVVGEDGTVIGTTNTGETACDTTATMLTVDAGLINAWAIDGEVELKLIPSDAPGGAMSINDICPDASMHVTLEFISAMSDTLPVSFMVDSLPVEEVGPDGEVMLSLSGGDHLITWIATDCGGNTGTCQTVVSVLDGEAPEIVCPGDMSLMVADAAGCTASIWLQAPQVMDSCGIDTSSATYAVSGDTIIVATSFGGADSIELILTAGEFIIEYSISDLSGNTSTCAFEVSVGDPLPPQAACKSALIYVDPSGLIPAVIDPAMIDAGSTDNCNIDTMYVMPSEFTCASAGTTQMVELVVVDIGGNSDTCVAEVQIEVAGLSPSYMAGLCETDTLKLFANVPAGQFTFDWTGPNGFASSEENPVIPDAEVTDSGVYTVTAVSANGCMSSGSVEVTAGVVSEVAISAESLSVCDGAEVTLSATSYSQGVEYEWYRGDPPNGLLLGSTSDTFFIDIPPLPDSYTYYVIVHAATCTLGPSDPIVVEVFEMPEAIVNQSFIEVCEGGMFSLGTEVVGPDITYSWSGPAGYTSSEQNPAVSNVTPSQGGSYELVVLRGECASLPVTVDVAVAPRPARPVISGDSIFCLGGDLVLIADSTMNADLFIWQPPGMQAISTQTDTLRRNNIGLALTGEWTVVAMLGDCPSEPSEPFNVVIEEALPVIASNTGPFCKGSTDSITLLVDPIPGLTYQWVGPAGFISNEPNPRIPGIAGTYTVTATSSSGCTGISSTIVTAEDPPAITALSNSAGDCADTLQQLTFALTLFPPDPGSYSYYWTGPNGFESTDKMPQIPGLSPELNGTYTLVVSLGSCTSAPVTTEVDVAAAPQQPQITGELSYCSGESLELSAPDYPGDSVLYVWHTPVGDFEVWNDSVLIIDNLTSSNSGNYSVEVQIHGCGSILSPLVNVIVSQVVATPFINAPASVCEGDTLRLTTQQIDNASYEWIGPNGFSAQTRNPFIYPATIEDAGEFTVIVSVGECVSDTSSPVIVDVLPLPAIPVTDPFEGAICLEGSDPLEVCVSTGALTPGALYTWTYLGNPVALPVSEGCLTLADFSGFDEGLNVLEVTAELNGCVSAGSGTLTIQMDAIPNETAEAGPFTEYCVDDIVMLNATDPGIGYGTWSSNQPGVTFSDPGDPFATITGLTPGVNQLVWTLSYASCFDYSFDTVNIELEVTPLAVNDTVMVQFGETTDFNILANDVIPGLFTVSLINGPAHGNTLLRDLGLLTYDPNLGYVGTDRIEYLLCSALCPEQCTVGVVILQVGDENDCFIPSIFTPNGDGTNDRLIIPCLESQQMQSSRLIVFNEWGNTVFEAEPYQNDWDGTRDGKDLPVATYFYVMDFGDGRPVQSGFLVLER